MIEYFKHLSDIFYEIESNREPSTEQKIRLEQLREQCMRIIQQSGRKEVFDSYVHEGVIKPLIEKERQNNTGLNNWILVFNWNEASFVTWDIVSRKPEEAVQSYIKHEKDYPSKDGFEMVLIGSSDIQSVQKTHSHYFGLEKYENILETLEQSIQVFSRSVDIDIGARKILAAMVRHRYWGSKTVKAETLKNHFCKGIFGFDDSLKTLFDKGYIKHGKDKDFSLNLEKKTEIDSY